MQTKPFYIEFEQFIAAVENLCDTISEEEKSYLLGCFTLVNLPTKHFFVQANTVPRAVNEFCHKAMTLRN
jgi:hypothetical protein